MALTPIHMHLLDSLAETHRKRLTQHRDQDAARASNGPVDPQTQARADAALHGMKSRYDVEQAIIKVMDPSMLAEVDGELHYTGNVETVLACVGLSDVVLKGVPVLPLVELAAVVERYKGRLGRANEEVQLLQRKFKVSVESSSQEIDQLTKDKDEAVKGSMAKDAMILQIRAETQQLLAQLTAAKNEELEQFSAGVRGIIEKLNADLVHQRKVNDLQCVTLSQQRTELDQQCTTLSQQRAELEQEREQHQAALSQQRTELEQQCAALKKQCATLEQEREQQCAALSQQRTELEQQCAALKKQCTTLEQEREQQCAARTQHQAELAQLAAAKAAELAQLAADNDDLTQKLVALSVGALTAVDTFTTVATAPNVQLVLGDDITTALMAQCQRLKALVDNALVDNTHVSTDVQ
jgi:hypothetical protein